MTNERQYIYPSDKPRADRVKDLRGFLKMGEDEGFKLLVSRFQVSEILEDWVFEKEEIDWRHHDNGLLIDKLDDGKQN